MFVVEYMEIFELVENRLLTFHSQTLELWMVEEVVAALLVQYTSPHETVKKSMVSHLVKDFHLNITFSNLSIELFEKYLVNPKKSN